MPSTHLSSFERGQIHILLKQGMNPMNIAGELGRAPSMIGREIKRNSTPRGYDPERAQHQYDERRKACRPNTKLDYAPLFDYVVSRIRDEEWTPEIVSIRLPLDFPDDLKMRVSYETIYRDDVDTALCKGDRCLPVFQGL